jgi:hypothetical protein
MAKYTVRQWTTEEIIFLEDNKDKTSYFIAKELGRSQSSVASKRRNLSSHREFRCAKCGVIIQSGGKYCSDHIRLGRQIRWYRHGVSKRGGDLKTEDIIHLLEGDCFYCGKPSSGGIDRADSSLGYYHGNVRSCCSVCNIIKMDMREDVFFSHIKNILERHNG